MNDWPLPDHDSGDGDDDAPEQDYPPCPPPDVWEFYRRHGRWPLALEA